MSGFKTCEACAGHGFLRRGDFANRTFPRCEKCEGIGCIYLDPPPKPVEDVRQPHSGFYDF